MRHQKAISPCFGINEWFQRNLTLILSMERPYINNTYRKSFKDEELVLGEHDTWHKLDTCV